jgi:uncharacterized protein (DUF1810 family)
MNLETFELERFLLAQSTVYDRVLSELRSGTKQSHWMWFIFPQVSGLGTSAMSVRYSIANLDEARAFFCHPILGSRLRECVDIVIGLRSQSATEVFGTPDDLKFRSSMTLFHLADPSATVFSDALAKYFGSKLDAKTIAILEMARHNEDH